MSHSKEMAKAVVAALGAHGAWKLRLRTAVNTGNSTITPQQARCDKSCEFGRWLHGTAIDPGTRRGKPYEVVSRLHREFHDCAGRVLQKAVSGESDDAAALLAGEFSERSDKLGRALTKWRGELERG